MKSSLLNLASLELALRAVAVAQFAVAILNLFLIRIMKWKPDLERAPLIIREVFRIHVVFISITLSIFAALTWRFAYEIARASSPLTIWLAVAIGLFWLRCSAMPCPHYSPRHSPGAKPATLNASRSIACCFYLAKDAIPNADLR